MYLLFIIDYVIWHFVFLLLSAVVWRVSRLCIEWDETWHITCNLIMLNSGLDCEMSDQISSFFLTPRLLASYPGYHIILYWFATTPPFPRRMQKFTASRTPHAACPLSLSHRLVLRLIHPSQPSTPQSSSRPCVPMPRVLLPWIRGEDRHYFLPWLFPIENFSLTLCSLKIYKICRSFRS